MWKQFRDTNYEVSDEGRIRNLKTGREIRQFNKKKGEHPYKKVNIRINGEKRTFSVHRMVLETFTNRDDKKQVNHKNLKPDDNKLSNLEYVTREENMEHAFKNSKKINQRKPVVRMNIETKEIIEFRSLYMAGKYIASKKRESGKKITEKDINHYATSIKQAINGKINNTDGCYWWFKEDFDFENVENMIEGKKKPDKYTKEQQEKMRENNLNTSIISRRMKKYGLTLDEALTYKRHHIFAEPKEIKPNPNSKYMQGVGKRFGNLKVIDVIRIRGKKPLYKCQCDCEKIFITQSTNVLLGKTKGCGCKNRKV